MVKLGVISGGFDPIHAGHIAYINAAAEQCDYLFVGVNSDAWLERKKGKAFMPYQDRYEIVKNLKGVHEVIHFCDADDSAFNIIEKVYAIGVEMFNDINFEVIFFNGGDRTKENIPEQVLCLENELPCTFKFGVGGTDKKNSSSWILEKWNKPTTERAWGSYTVLDKNEGWQVKQLSFEPKQALSNQRHTYRSEHWHVVSGVIRMHLTYPNGDKLERELGPGDSIDIPVGTWHQAFNHHHYPANVIEVWLGDTLSEEDIERK